AGRVCLPARGMDGRRCADDCMTGMCEEGEVCNPNTGICDPRCRSGECPEGQQCNADSGLCDPIPDCPDDDVGASIAAATAIELGAPMELNATIENGPTARVGAVPEGILCPSTSDVYKVSVPPSSRVRIQVQRRDAADMPGAPLDFKVIGKVVDNPCEQGDATCDAGWICEERTCTATADFIEDAQGDMVGRDTSVVEFPAAENTAINPVDYYISLDGLNERLAYTITVSVVTEGADGSGGACFPDPREPDNNRDLAEDLPQGISDGRLISGTLCGDDKDFFAIDLGAADQLSVDLVVTSGDADDVQLYVFRDGTMQGDGLVAGNSYSSPANDGLIPGKYFIIVQSTAGGDGSLGYTLAVNHVPGAVNCPDDDQSGDIAEVAASPNIDPMADGETDIGEALGVQLAICDPTEPDVDVFCFEVQPGENLGAAVVGDNAGDLLVEWRTADNRRLVEGRGTVAEAVFLNVNVTDDAATVYCFSVRAVPNMGNQAVSFPYRLTIRRAAGEPGMCQDDNEPQTRNDIAARASDLVANDENNPTRFSLAGGSANVCDTERPEEDWYRFSITEANSSICVTLNNFNPAGVEFDLAMYPAVAPSDSVTCQRQNDCDTPQMNGASAPGGACIPDQNGTSRCTPPFNQAEYKTAYDFEMISRDRSIIRADAVGDYLLRVFKAKERNASDEGLYNLNVLVRPTEPDCREDDNTPNGDDGRVMARDLGSGETAICDSWICRETSDSDWYSIDVPAGQDRTVLIEYPKETEGAAKLKAYAPTMGGYSFGPLDNPGFGQSARTAGNFQCINIKGGDMGNDRKVYLEVAAGAPSGNEAFADRLDYSMRVIETDLSVKPQGECELLTNVMQPVCPPFEEWEVDALLERTVHPSGCWSTVTVP
ncbi:MAG: hypothetical protein VX589_04185, partial [Myxococcota bacterium]|nr:hypothetical protein [Myxococcota bacterium]